MNKGVIGEFRDFISQGNVIDLAVAVIMAGAFTPVITALVEKVIMPIIAAIVGEPDFNGIGFDIGDARVGIGFVITALVNFLLIAAAVFFFIIKPMNMLKARQKADPASAPPPPEDITLLREIRDLLSRR